MKKFMIILGSLVAIFIVLQGFLAMSTSNVEDYQYEVLATYPNFEIRKYKKAIFSSVDMRTDSYESTSRSGFRILAGYIFGGNETGEQIAMTSPVAMSIDGEKPKMSFMVPASYHMDSLPKPSDSSIYFEEKESCIMAATRFGGWANDKKIEKHKQKLIEALAKENIQHDNNFSYFGYNPPYEVFNRRNEVVVEVSSFEPIQ